MNALWCARNGNEIEERIHTTGKATPQSQHNTAQHCLVGWLPEPHHKTRSSHAQTKHAKANDKGPCLPWARAEIAHSTDEWTSEEEPEG